MHNHETSYNHFISCKPSQKKSDKLIFIYLLQNGEYCLVLILIISKIVVHLYSFEIIKDGKFSFKQLGFYFN